jgi:hypothetical protein
MESTMHRNFFRTLFVGALGLIAVIAANAADHGSEAVGNCHAMVDPAEPTICE